MASAGPRDPDLDSAGAARDRVLLGWLGRLGAATLEQLRARFSLGRTVAYRRVAACIDAGLLDRVYLLYRQAAMLRVTSRGLRYAGLALPVARLSPELAAHWIACTWAAIRLADAEPAAMVVSERELRLCERIEGRALASAEVAQTAGGSERLHRPDLVLVGAGRVEAIEIELTPKAPQRLERILRAWCRTDCVDRVRYYADGQTHRAVERAIERVHGADRIELRPLGDVA